MERLRESGAKDIDRVLAANVEEMDRMRWLTGQAGPHAGRARAHVRQPRAPSIDPNDGGGRPEAPELQVLDDHLGDLMTAVNRNTDRWPTRCTEG
jgi:hypothetical protein